MEAIKTALHESIVDWRQLIGMDETMSEIGTIMDGGRMHPVVMLEGREGIGKRHLAMWMVARLLCQQTEPQKKACGQCGACREVLAGIHPDVMVLNLGADSIKTNDVEQLQNHFSMLSSGGMRIGVIMNADRMTVEACNRALKTLEEPPEQVRVILTSSRPLGLPATVRGRCLRWRVKPPGRVTVLDWMRKTLESHGRPPEKDEHLQSWAMRLGFSPGLILRELEDNVDHESGIFGDVRMLLSANKPIEVTQAASNLARVHKAKVPEILNAVEWELNRLNRQRVLRANIEESNQDKEALGRINRRNLLRSIRRQAVFDKVTLNAQLVVESIGLTQWET